jgi:hypothetical protein
LLTDPIAISERLVGLDDVCIIGLEDLGTTLHVHIESRMPRPWCRVCGVLLFLDDFAMREFTAAQADGLYELVSGRESKSIVITANGEATDWYSRFPNPVVAESILDRVVNRAHHLHMEGRSYRPQSRPAQRSEP